MNETRYMISDASKQLHVEAHVLRYWEDELEMEIPRTELGHRYYTKQHLLTFERIKRLKETGYQLKAIKLILPKLAQLDAEEFEFISLVADEMNRRAAELYGEAASSGEDTPEAPAAGQASAAQTAEQTLYGPPEKEAVSETAGPAEASFSVMQSETAEAPAPAEEELSAKESLPSNVIPMTRVPGELTHEERLQQFQAVMTNAVSGAMQLQAKQFGSLLSEQVSEKLLTELDYLLRLRQEQEELRFQQLDETIRSHQKSLQEAAAGRAPAKRKRRR